MTERLCGYEWWTGGPGALDVARCTRTQHHDGKHEQRTDTAICDATCVYWPDVEAIDVQCYLSAGHDGPHEDEDGDWTRD